MCDLEKKEDELEPMGGGNKPPKDPDQETDK